VATLKISARVNRIAAASAIAFTIALGTSGAVDAQPRASAEAHGEEADLPVLPFTVVNAYDPPAKNWLAGHRGIDVEARVGQKVQAPHESLVHFAGVVANRPVLTLKLTNGDLVSFEPVDPQVTTGERVARGEVVGKIAREGQEHCVEASCLHIGLRRGGEYLNPLILWREVRPKIILLPPL